MSLLAPEPIKLAYRELPGAVSAREFAEHYKLYLGYRDMLKRVDGALPTVPFPKKHQPESALASMLRGQGYALAGAYLHELYFGNLEPSTIKPMILLGVDKPIEHGWGGRQALVEDMIAAGLQARGWVVLAVCAKCPEDLRVFALDGHDVGAAYGYCPLLVIDVYEHAYWMDFGTDKAGYLTNIMRYVNWNAADVRYREVHPV